MPSVEQAAVLKHVRGRLEGQQVPVESTQAALERPRLGSLSAALILHPQQLVCQVVQPQHISVGVVLTPFITAREREREDSEGESERVSERV